MSPSNVSGKSRMSPSDKTHPDDAFLVPPSRHHLLECVGHTTSTSHSYKTVNLWNDLKQITTDFVSLLCSKGTFPLQQTKPLSNLRETEVRGVHTLRTTMFTPRNTVCVNVWLPVLWRLSFTGSIVHLY